MTLKLNGCHSIPRATEKKLLIVQDGYQPIVHDGFGNPQMVPKYIYIHHFTDNTLCHYDHNAESDPGCKGCPTKRVPNVA